MKHFLKLFLALASSVILFASCNKDTYGTRTYGSMYVSTSGVADSLSRVQIIDHCRSVEYFTKDHTYTGTYQECFEKATSDFQTAILMLDDEYIEDRLGVGEDFSIFCIEQSSGGYIAYTTWYNAEGEE